MPRLEFSVPLLDQSTRVDVYASTLENIPRSRLKMGLQKLTIDGKKAKLSTKLRGDERVLIEWENSEPEEICPQDIPLDVLFENDDVAILNKKQGMVVHPGAGNWDNTLVNALLFKLGKPAVKNIPATARPGIVHRLDKDTSGGIIVAKNEDSEEWLKKQFKDRRVKKEYICIVCGRPPQKDGSIKTQIVRDSKNRKKFVTSDDPQKGKFAHSVYRCIAIYGDYSLMRVTLKTGRTHQIRVHMKHLGCPVLGDAMYGKRDSLFSNATLMLHSRLLGIRINEEANFTLFKAPVPLRFKKVLKTLHENYEKLIME